MIILNILAKLGIVVLGGIILALAGVGFWFIWQFRNGMW